MSINSAYDFKAMGRDEMDVLFDESWDNLKSSMPLKVETAIHDIAGMISAYLNDYFDLSGITKRDIALHLVAQGRNLESFMPFLPRIMKYIRGYFCLAFAELYPIENKEF